MAEDWVKDYVGIPFKERGRDRNGVDCWGLVYLIYKERFGIEIESYTGDYSTTKDRKTIERLLRQGKSEWEPVEEGKQELGDVIICLVKKRPVHTGLVIDKRHVLHVDQGIDSVYQDYTSRLWTQVYKIEGFYRHLQSN